MFPTLAFSLGFQLEGILLTENMFVQIGILGIVVFLKELSVSN